MTVYLDSSYAVAYFVADHPDHRRALQLAPTISVENALFYDLLHCVSADAAGADELWTLNGKDFTRLQSETKAAVRVPLG